MAEVILKNIKKVYSHQGTKKKKKGEAEKKINLQITEEGILALTASIRRSKAPLHLASESPSPLPSMELRRICLIERVELIWNMKNKLWYEAPAIYWSEALPLGNGRIGAMVFGGGVKARFALNEDTLWSGYLHDPNESGRAAIYRKSRELVHRREYLAAQRCIEEGFTGEFSQAYMPLGDLLLEFQLRDDEISDYQRCLDMETATHNVTFNANSCHVCRTCWVSQPHQVLAIRIKSSRPVSFALRLDSQLRHNITTVEGSCILDGQCPSCADPEYLHTQAPIRYDPAHPGIRFRAIARAQGDGVVTAASDGIVVRDSTDTLVLLAVRSSFTRWNEAAEGTEYIERVQKDMEAALAVGVDALLEAHCSEYQAYYNRASLELPETANSALPTDRRQLAFQSDPTDLALIALLFQYGRYLLISSSRPGTQAANLQGIWNENLLPPWSSNYTLNINTEMNYWPAFSCNLAELQEPLERMVCELAEAGRKTASEYYGAQGFVVHHNSDLWRLCIPVGQRRRGAKHDYWPLAGGWLCRHLFERYAYTMDRVFLSETAFPVMKQAALFFLDVLSEDSDGYLSFSPATSPENQFWLDDEKVAVSEDNTMTASILRELFQNCIKTCRILETDADFAERLECVLRRLRPLSVGSDGRLMEWEREFAETEVNHRHTSHLYGLYPGSEITPEKTPLLAEGCRRTLIDRGMDCTGWSLAWKICLWARLRDGERAWEALRCQLRPSPPQETKARHTDGGSYASLLCAHPPFQIDGNFGATAGIAELLVQGDGAVLELLPALPSLWKCGRVRGLCVRGGFCVDMDWSDNDLSCAVIYSKLGGQMEVRWPTGSLKCNILPDRPFTIRP